MRILQLDTCCNGAAVFLVLLIFALAARGAVIHSDVLARTSGGAPSFTVLVEVEADRVRCQEQHVYSATIAGKTTHSLLIERSAGQSVSMVIEVEGMRSIVVTPSNGERVSASVGPMNLPESKTYLVSCVKGQVSIEAGFQ